MSDSARVPHELRRYVVEQDYAQYSEIDQAVWRFVLLQTHQRLQHTAHPAYRDGLAQTGISVERIPRISEMSERLQRFGWSAVCVDGFIPPRAFQEFQAASILPIAADMRSREHLVYTPAPDIIHEAAGHAPILPDPRYAGYLRAIGDVGKKAFSSPEDSRVYRAIFELSELKETRGVTPEAVLRAEARLEQALSAVISISEANRLSRLYWWTAEYGLVGTPDDYRLYGAGLLSSLWESHACHDPAVRKVPLNAACIDQGYDITRPQPQLYVARDFEHLFDVLSEVGGGLAHRAGGSVALRAALASEELATCHFRDGRFVTGVLSSARSDLLRFSGRVGLGVDGRLSSTIAEGYFLPLAAHLPDGARCGERVVVPCAGGLSLSGELAELGLDGAGRPWRARLLDYCLRSERDGVIDAGQEYELVPDASFETAHAGASDPSYFPASEPSLVRVPKPRELPARERELLGMYEQAIAAFRAQLGGDAVRVFAKIHGELRRSFPDEWLLRWNLLECLCKLGQGKALSSELSRELEALELKFANRQPIASGLRYLAALAA